MRGIDYTLKRVGAEGTENHLDILLKVILEGGGSLLFLSTDVNYGSTLESHRGHKRKFLLFFSYSTKFPFLE